MHDSLQLEQAAHELFPPGWRAAKDGPGERLDCLVVRHSVTKAETHDAHQPNKHVGVHARQLLHYPVCLGAVRDLLAGCALRLGNEVPREC